MELSEEQLDQELLHSMLNIKEIQSPGHTLDPTDGFMWTFLVERLKLLGIRETTQEDILASVKRLLAAGKITLDAHRKPRAFSNQKDPQNNIVDFGILLTKSGRAEAEKYQPPTASYPAPKK